MIQKLCEQIISKYYGADLKISSMKPVHGGDCSDAFKAVLTDGNELFVKANSARNYGFFECETEGLEAIHNTDAISVPKVLGTDLDSTDSVLVMEILESGKKKRDFWEVFGQQLAQLHKADASGFVEGGLFGFTRNNYIGAGRQVNTPREDWISFFRDYNGYAENGSRL